MTRGSMGLESVDTLAAPPMAVKARDVVVIHAGSAGPVAALRGLDLDVLVGEIAVIVGPSGSGKSTLLRLVSGLGRPAAGTIDVLGLGFDRESAGAIADHRRSRIGIVEQHYRKTLSPYATVEQIVGLPLAIRGIERRERAERVRYLLGAIGLDDRRSATSRELSGGEQQRVAVAAALAPRPQLLLADEPTGELDSVTSAAVLALLRDLVRADGATALIVTHDTAVEAIADRVVVLQDGRAVALRSAAGLGEQPITDERGWQAPVRTWRSSLAAEARNRGSAAASSAGPSLHTAGPAVLTNAEPAVQVLGVAKAYGKGRSAMEALRDVSVDFPAFGLHAVAGPSGAGKSTLLRLIGGLETPNAGSVRVLGRDLAELDRTACAALRAERIGLVEQARGLVPFLTIRENVALTLRMRGAAPGGSLDEARLTDEALAAVGILQLAGRRPAELSAGERTRAAIGRAIVAGPSILLLDEPTATLDRVSSEAIATLMTDLGRTISVIVATHDPALIAAADTRLDLVSARQLPA